MRKLYIVLGIGFLLALFPAAMFKAPGSPSLASSPSHPAASCKNLHSVQAKGKTWCTHGYDPSSNMPSEASAALIKPPCVKLIGNCKPSPSPTPSPTVSPSPSPSPSPKPVYICDGDGQSGKRVQAIYVRSADWPDQLEDFRAAMNETITLADKYFAQQGGQHVRWACRADGTYDIGEVVIPSGQYVILGNFIAAAQNQGYSNPDRDYSGIVGYDTDSGGGIATINGDDSPGQTNYNNRGLAYSLTYSIHADRTLAHETSHNLGAVQLTAPHSSGAWHCYDELDLMCYNDGGSYFKNGGQMEDDCFPPNTPADGSDPYDCNRDDYYNMNPAAGSYLTTHWNLANSAFLTHP